MSTMVPMYGFGGGGTGAELAVTAPAGCTVTVSKDGKTKTKIAGGDGTAVFRGLATGTWTVNMTDGAQTAPTRTASITADYAITMSFFSATLHITYPEGSTCTVSDGVTTFTAPDTSGAWDCVVPNAGTWTVTVVDKGWTDTVELTESGQSVDVDLTVFHLYKSGDEFTRRTGGWDFATYGGGGKGFNNSISSKQADCISVHAYPYSQCAVWTKNAIDLTHFSTLHIKLKTGSTYMGFGVFDTYGSASAITNSPAVSETYYLESAVDISGQSGLFYVWLGSWANENVYGGDISEVWLT